MSRLIVSNIETQNIKFDSDTTAFTIASDGRTSGIGMGAKILLNSVTASSVASVEFKHGTNGVVFDNTYSRYEISVDEAIPSDNDRDLEMLLSGDTGGSYFGDSQYNCLRHEGYTNGSSHGTTASYANDFALTTRVGQGNTASRGGTMGTVLLSKPNTNKYVQVYGSFWGWTHNSYLKNCISVGHREDQVAIDAVKFQFSTGNIASGVFKFYGIR